jgi:hypothetical protein
MALCKLGEILQQATAEESQALETALSEVKTDGKYKWSAKTLANAVNKTRFSVGSTTVKEHRRNACGCSQ